MATTSLPPVFIFQAFDANGNPLAGGKLYSYAAGTLTPQATYTDQGGGTAAANPIILDANGQAPLWLGNLPYKFNLTDANDVQQPNYPVDQVMSGYAPAAILRSDLLSEDVALGDALVTVKQPFTGAVARTQHSKNTDVATIEDFGGKGDGSTDCAAALTAAITGGNGTIRFPFVPGASNVYYFSAFNPNYFQNAVLDVDTGVVISTPTNDIFAPSTINLRFTRPTTFYWRNLGNYATIGRTRKLDGTTTPAPDKDLFVGPGDFDYSEVVNVLCNGGSVTPLEIVWNGSDTWASDSFTSVGTNYFTRTIAATDSKIHLGMIRVIPGMEYSAEVLPLSGSPLLYAVLRSTDGFSGMTWTQTMSNYDIEWINKAIGMAGTSIQQNYIWSSGAGKHSSYHPTNSIITIRVVSWNRVDILFNGFVARTFTIPPGSAVFQVGFGGYAAANGDAFIVRNLTQTKYKPATFNSLLSCRIFGDSRSAPHLDSWVEHLKNAMDLTAGVRLWKIDNQAVSGQNSAAQWAQMQSVGVTDVDAVIIDIGTNDVQGSTGVATFTANLTNMIDTVQAAGKYLIVCNFDLWYTQALAGGIGQNATNYDAGAQYRAALLQLCGEKGVKVVDHTAYSGPVLAHYVNAALGTDLTTAGDSYMGDNIHQTSQANRLRALHVARAFCGLLMSRPSLAQPPIALTNVKNGWTISLQSIYATIDEAGTVTFDGLLSAGTKTNGTVVMTLPQHLWPSRNKRFLVYTNAAEVVSVAIDKATGDISIYGASAMTYFSFDSLTWNLQ